VAKMKYIAKYHKIYINKKQVKDNQKKLAIGT